MGEDEDESDEEVSEDESEPKEATPKPSDESPTPEDDDAVRCFSRYFVVKAYAVLNWSPVCASMRYRLEFRLSGSHSVASVKLTLSLVTPCRPRAASSHAMQHLLNAQML